MIRPRASVLGLLLLVSLGAGAGCAHAVRPQEKEFLADRIMQFEPNPGEAGADEHVLSNREAAMGGRGTAGGGCGCN